MSKFTDLVTEAVGSLEMGIELKMPDERYSNIAATPAAMAKAAVDSDIVTHFEGVLEKWCDDTEKMLEEKQQPPKEGDEQGPETEFDYWRTRMAKFNNVVEQLKNPMARVVVGVLQTAKSR